MKTREAASAMMPLARARSRTGSSAGSRDRSVSDMCEEDDSQEEVEVLSSVRRTGGLSLLRKSSVGKIKNSMTVFKKKDTQALCSQTAAVVAMSIQGAWISLSPEVTKAMNALLVFPTCFDESGALVVVGAVMPGLTLETLRPILTTLLEAQLLEPLVSSFATTTRLAIPPTVRQVLVHQGVPNHSKTMSSPASPLSVSKPSTPTRRSFSLDPLPAVQGGSRPSGVALSTASPTHLGASSPSSSSSAAAAGPGAAAISGTASNMSTPVITGVSGSKPQTDGKCADMCMPPAQCPPEAVAAFVQMMCDELAAAGAMYASNMTMTALSMFDADKASMESLMRLGSVCKALPLEARQAICGLDGLAVQDLLTARISDTVHCSFFDGVVEGAESTPMPTSASGVGSDNPAVRLAKLQICLSRSLSLTKQTERALAVGNAAMATIQKELGPQDPLAATALNRMAGVMKATGQKQAALDMYRQCYEIRVATLGRMHKDVALAMNNIALVQASLGQRQEALSTLQQCLDIRVAVLGRVHADVASTMFNIGIELVGLGRKEEALESYRQCIDIRKQVFGDRHPQLASALFNLAFTLTGAGRLEEALDAYQQCYDIRVSVLGAHHSSTLAALNNSAYVLESMNRQPEALERYQQCLEVAIACHGPSHTEVAEIQRSVADVLVKLYRCTEAIALHKQSCALLDELIGPKQLKTVVGKEHLAQAILLSGNDVGEAVSLFQTAVSTRVALQGEDNKQVALVLTKLSRACEAAGDADGAVDALERSIIITSNLDGSSSSAAVIKLLRRLVKLLVGRPSDQLLALQRLVTAIETSTSATRDVDLAAVLSELIDLQERLGQSHEAEKTRARLASIAAPPVA